MIRNTTIQNTTEGKDMEKSGKTPALLLAVVLLAMTSACISVTYDGVENLPPLPSDAKVAVYYEKSLIPVPETQYTKIGEVTASASTARSASTASFTMTQIKARIVEEARERGANGVLIQSVDMRRDGEVRSDQVKNLGAPTWTTVDNSASNIAQERDLLIYSSGSDPDVPTYEITIRAMLFSMPEAALKAALRKENKSSQGKTGSK